VSCPHKTGRDTSSAIESVDDVIAATQTWLERAVIGLGLCPFAANVHLRRQIRYRVSEQVATAGLLEDLVQELQHLDAEDPQRCETTLLIHPQVLTDFADYNEFLNEADAALRGLDLQGKLQIASFHPTYQFAGCAPDAIDNYSNRSPYPTLHLLREASVERAVQAFPDTRAIGNKNIATLRQLGKKGWQQLWLADHTS
jgi:uncharacterized protein